MFINQICNTFCSCPCGEADISGCCGLVVEFFEANWVLTFGDVWLQQWHSWWWAAPLTVTFKLLQALAWIKSSEEGKSWGRAEFQCSQRAALSDLPSALLHLFAFSFAKVLWFQWLMEWLLCVIRTSHMYFSSVFIWNVLAVRELSIYCLGYLFKCKFKSHTCLQ